MRKVDVSVIVGLLLILVGGLFLLQTLDVLVVGDYVWPFLFGAGGVVFLYVFLANREHWWAVIPGFTLLGLAGLIALSEFGPEGVDDWSAAFFLGMIGLSFWVIYLNAREHWWAVIPGGVMLTVALMVGLAPLLESGFAEGGIFFLGLGLTFALLALLPTPEGPMKWAWIPAAVLLVMGALIVAALESLLQYVGPVALILGGGYLVLRVLRSSTG
jgi:hypothetical protein